MSTVQTLEVPGYQVMRFLGSGARSTIWRIRDRRTDESYALKRVVKRHASDGRFLQQAINEYTVAQHLEHAVIRRIHSLRRVKRWLSVREILLVMELCHGKTIQDSRPGTTAEAVRIFLQVAGSLAYMNSAGFVHADIKPNNIIVASDDTVKVIDLGQSCPIGTVKERIQGTPDFIAPEQVHRRPLDARTDVFNFGATFYWTLTGRPIPTALPKQGSMMLKTDMSAKPADHLNPDIPGPLSKLIGDCIEPRRSRRPSSMREVSSRLELVLHVIQRNGNSSKE